MKDMVLNISRRELVLISRMKLQKNERAYSFTEIQGCTMLRGLNLGQDYHYRNAYRRGINENQWEH